MDLNKLKELNKKQTKTNKRSKVLECWAVWLIPQKAGRLPQVEVSGLALPKRLGDSPGWGRGPAGTFFN